MADEMRALGKTFRFENAAAGLTQTPLLALTADDGLAPDTDALVPGIQARAAAKSQRCTSPPITTGQTTVSLLKAQSSPGLLD